MLALRRLQPLAPCQVDAMVAGIKAPLSAEMAGIYRALLAEMVATVTAINPVPGDSVYYACRECDGGDVDWHDRGKIIAVDGGLAVRWDRDHRIDRIADGCELANDLGSVHVARRRKRTAAQQRENAGDSNACNLLAK